jgi:uncharacterized membrane protein
MEVGHFILRYAHITGGLLALGAGAGSMIYKKGSPMHRQHGRVFWAAMVTMSLTGLYGSLFMEFVPANIMGGSTAFYLTMTAWATVWRPAGKTGRLEIGVALWGLTAAITGISFGMIALGSPKSVWGEFSATGYFVFSGILLLGVALDAKVIARGGVTGTPRLTRHIWRICLAFFMATGSFFFGQAKLFPVEIRQSGLLAIPAMLPLGLMLYWLLKVRVWPKLRSIFRRNAAPPDSWRPWRGTPDGTAGGGAR